MHASFDSIVRLEDDILRGGYRQDRVDDVDGSPSVTWGRNAAGRLDHPRRAFARRCRRHRRLLAPVLDDQRRLRSRHADIIRQRILPREAADARQAAMELIGELREAGFSKLGNPAIWVTHETADVERSEPDIRMSTFGINDRRMASAWAAFTEDTRNNEFHARVRLDNDERFYLSGPSIYAAVRVEIRFVLDPPEGHWFLVDRIWSPLMGRGTFNWVNGVHPWWSVALIERHGLLGYGRPYAPLGLTGSFTQDGRNATHTWSFTYETGDPVPHPGFEPGYMPTWDGGVFALPDAFSQVDDASFLIRGRASGGRAVTFTIRIGLGVAARHVLEEDEASFRDEGFLMFPGLAVFGERIDL